MFKKQTLLLTAIFFASLFFLLAKDVQAQNLMSGQRLEGIDRYETAVKISQAGWPETSETAILTTGEDFPDALSAAPLAKKYNAPILLTEPGELNSKVEQELSRLKAKNVYIIGGTGVVSQSIEDKLKLNGIACTRLFGADRYETCAAIANAVGASERIVVATGENYPDALSIAPWAASKGVPILLTETEALPPSIAEYIKNNENNIVQTYIAGGEGVVSSTVMSQLKNAVRLEGQDRFGTNLDVLSKLGAEFDFSKVYMATGNDYPDALSGSALAALTNAPIILIDKEPLPDTKKYIEDNINGMIDSVYILGGEAVVSDSIVSELIPPRVWQIEITVPNTNIKINEQIAITANIKMIPSNATTPTVTFSSSDPTIVDVTQDGVVTGLKPGVAIVSVDAGGKTASINIAVKIDKLIVIDPGHGGITPGAVPKTPDGKQLTQYKESVLNLQIAQKVKAKLQALGMNVIMTREGDTTVSLEDRANMANSINADLFLSIHHDSATAVATGTTAFYSNYKPGVDTQDVYVRAEIAGNVLDVNRNVIGKLTVGSEYEYVKEENGDIYIMYNGVPAIASIDYVVVYDRTPSEASQKSMELAKEINGGIASLGLYARGAKDGNLAVTRLTNGVSVLVEVGFLSNYSEFLMISQDSFQESIADKIVQAIADYYNN